MHVIISYLSVDVTRHTEAPRLPAAGPFFITVVFTYNTTTHIIAIALAFDLSICGIVSALCIYTIARVQRVTEAP